MICGVFPDFSNAFDTVNHTILLSKLQVYGISGTPLTWCHSYLSNREQYVGLGEVKSPKQTMLCGIPQGSTFVFTIHKRFAKSLRKIMLQNLCRC